MDGEPQPAQRWSTRAGGHHIDLEWRDGEVYLEDGPSDWPRRGHEGGGGTFTIQQIRRDLDFLDRYPGLRERLVADLAPRLRVVDARSAVLTTVTPDLAPHAVPCCFAIEGRRIYTPVDSVKPKTTTSLQRLENIAACPKVSLLVDHYDDDWEQLWWARLDGTAELVADDDWRAERGTELLSEKYPQYVGADLQIIVVDIERWVSWPDDV